MTTNFIIQALPHQDFQHLFSLTDEELKKKNIIRKTVEKPNVTPCRISLEDAKVGEEILLLPFQHLKFNSPYQSSRAIFIRKSVKTKIVKENEIPEMLRRRLLSIRAYDENGIMLTANVVQGTELKTNLHLFFEDPRICFVHIHNAKPGCYNCVAIRN